MADQETRRGKLFDAGAARKSDGPLEIRGRLSRRRDAVYAAGVEPVRARPDQEHRPERRAGDARRESHSDGGRCARAQRSDQRQRHGDQGQSSQRNGARQRSDVQGQPVLAVCAISEAVAAEAIERIRSSGSRCRSTWIPSRRWCRVRRMRASKATCGNGRRPSRVNRLAFLSQSTSSGLPKRQRNTNKAGCR